MNLPPSPQREDPADLDEVTRRFASLNSTRSSSSGQSSATIPHGPFVPIPPCNTASALGPIHAARSNPHITRPSLETKHVDSAPEFPTYRRTPSSSSSGSFTSPISPASGPSSYGSLSAAALIGGGISGTDVHAKLLDFQNKRQSRSNSLSKQQPNLNVATSSPTLSQVSSSPPKQSDTTVSNETGTGTNTSTLGGSLAFTSASSLRKVPSLSQRRGMKLDMSMASSPDASSSSANSSETSSPASTLHENLNSSSSSTSSNPVYSNGTATPTGAMGGSTHQSLSATLSRNGSGSIKRGNRPGQLPGRLPGGPKQSLVPGKGLFDSYKKYVDVKTGTLNFAGKASLHSKGIDFSSGNSFRISLDEFEPLGELGRGNYGTVTKVLHRPSNVIMAMKEIRLELDEQKFTQIIMELDVLHKCVSPFIVDFYGAFFVEGAVFICLEYMDGGSLDQIYAGGVAEPYLEFITESVVKGLQQLKEEHSIIHRDVKPTNILVSTSGKVKLTDFGVSGNLVASIARTNIGCQSYMAPERIRSKNPNEAITYTVESDVWSLGLSILETALGSYPYPPETYENIFSQLSAIVDGDPPSLPADQFSPEAISFVIECLNKNARKRPSYKELLQHPWINRWKNKEIDFGSFVQRALEKRDGNTSSTQSRPALHTVRPTDLASETNATPK